MRPELAFNRFLVDAKTWWMCDMFAALRAEYDARAAGKTVRTPEEVAALLADSALYPYFAWLERHIQKMKYASRYGLLASAETDRAAAEARLAEAGASKLTLNPDLAVPDYYSEIDTHQHPGNLHGDALAGLVYQASAMSTQPGSTSGLSLHVRVAEAIAHMSGGFRRIADLGCGFGKSTLPLAERFPQAEVIGFDLSAPCLRLAALQATKAQQQNLRYVQADAVKTGQDEASFDLVTSTMLLHEMPPPVVEDLFAETFRLLEPGGLSVHLDFRASDPFLRFIHHGHGFRNNEPYMEAIDRMDVEAAHARVGFETARIEPFAEADGATAPDFPKWRFPWTFFIARKPMEAGARD
ncbi:MAG: methyltransferase domain-containing protein [Acetobacteraceae bacterium]|nr:methyltransferase domain-containing protein [Acetobacteraceae bacterium]